MDIIENSPTQEDSHKNVEKVDLEPKEPRVRQKESETKNNSSPQELQNAQAETWSQEKVLVEQESEQADMEDANKNVKVDAAGESDEPENVKTVLNAEITHKVSEDKQFNNGENNDKCEKEAPFTELEDSGIGKDLNGETTVDKEPRDSVSPIEKNCIALPWLEKIIEEDSSEEIISQETNKDLIPENAVKPKENSVKPKENAVKSKENVTNKTSESAADKNVEKAEQKGSKDKSVKQTRARSRTKSSTKTVSTDDETKNNTSSEGDGDAKKKKKEKYRVRRYRANPVLKSIARKFQVYSSSVLNVAGQVTVAGYGSFSCYSEEHEKPERWSSNCAWVVFDLKQMSVVRRYKQGCRKCSTMVLPRLQHTAFVEMCYIVVRMYLYRSQHIPQRYPIQVPKRPATTHAKKLCERCQELKKPCINEVAKQFLFLCV